MSDDTEPKQGPKIILTHDRVGKNGKIYQTEVAAFFDHEDGRRRAHMPLQPTDGWLTAHDTREKLDALKAGRAGQETHPPKGRER